MLKVLAAVFHQCNHQMSQNSPGQQEIDLPNEAIKNLWYRHCCHNRLSLFEKPLLTVVKEGPLIVEVVGTSLK